MNEEDVLGGAVREPLRACCLKLAARLWALCQQAGFGDAKALQAGLPAQLWQRGALQDQPLRRECAHGEPSSPPAVSTVRMPAHPPKSNVPIPASQRATVAVRSAADTEATAGEGRLDASLAQLAAALDPSSAAAASRLQALELATAVLQVGCAAAPTAFLLAGFPLCLAGFGLPHC